MKFVLLSVFYSESSEVSISTCRINRIKCTGKFYPVPHGGPGARHAELHSFIESLKHKHLLKVFPYTKVIVNSTQNINQWE